MADTELTVNVTEFKANCLDLFKRLEAGKIKRITVTRRGLPVASIAPPPLRKKKKFEDIYGCMRGTIQFAPDYDPFEQVIEEPKDPFFG
jgi:antitoxin (DNA-binding transcriptional repressor) of toxin-antitoxin stability system